MTKFLKKSWHHTYRTSFSKVIWNTKRSRSKHYDQNFNPSLTWERKKSFLPGVRQRKRSCKIYKYTRGNDRRGVLFFYIRMLYKKNSKQKSPYLNKQTTHCFMSEYLSNRKQCKHWLSKHQSFMWSNHYLQN